MFRRTFRSSAVPIAFLVTTLGMAALPRPAYLEGGAPLDYDIFNGHFFTQGARSHSAAGFRVTDEAGITFWSEFQRLGGVERLGYPITRRFVWHGAVTQVTQRAVLQWSAPSETVQAANSLDYLSDVGRDAWLRANWRVPPRDPAFTVPHDVSAVLTWLDSLPDDLAPLARYYRAAPDPVALYGLPVAAPADYEDFVALRLQRTMLQLWKTHAPGASAGTVTALNVGDVLKDAGVLPEEAAVAEEPEPTRPDKDRVSPSSRVVGGPRQGLATWYGYDFAGRIMRDGHPFDPANPAIGASTVFPVGSWLRVTNIATNASIEVRVTDTGAFRYPLLVDLSWAAFRRLADPDVGVITVSVLPLHRD